MLSTFSQTAAHADGRFLNDQELQGLEAYVESFSARTQTYQTLSSQANELVLRSLRKLAQTHRQEVVTHSAKCKRDMDFALKEIARAVLLDEPEGFKQDFSLWMENITRAVHTNNAASRAYRCLKAEICTALPGDHAALVTPYLEELITAFSGH